MFEAALLIAAVRDLGLGVVSVPIDTRYSSEFRLSHFRPVRDVTLITLYTIGQVFRYGNVLDSYRRSHSSAPLVFDPVPSGADPHESFSTSVACNWWRSSVVSRILAVLLGRIGQPR